MRRLEKRKQIINIVISVAIMIILAALVVLLSSNLKKNSSEEKETSQTEKEEQADVLKLWYYDSEFDAYIENLCKEYTKDTGIEIQVVKMGYEDYLENINKANISKEDNPDLFITDSKQLEQAYLAGLTEINEKDKIYSEDNYSRTSLAAVTYKDKKVAYPFCFDTCFMVYNTKYTKKAPATFDDILDYSEGFDGEKFSKVRTILEWDVSDIIYNYGFVGEYLNCGGENGDDEDVLDVNNKELKSSLEYYQKLAQFFSIDMEDVNYTKVKKDFRSGEIVYALVKLDFIKNMEKSKTEYEVCPFPDLTKDLGTKSISLMSVVCVSPYSKHLEAAEKLAVYMTSKEPEKIYNYSGKLSARKHSYENDILNNVYEAHEKSNVFPKLMSMSDFETVIEIALNDIWNGAKAGDILKNLDKELGLHLSKK